MKAIIPAYVYPANPDVPPWSAWLRGTAFSGAIIVINPASGVGDEAKPEWLRVMRAISRSDRTPIGYVPLNYGRRPVEAVVAECEKYDHWYGTLGWFFDECPSSDEFRRYVALISGWATRAKYVTPRTVVFNPGTVPVSTLPQETKGPIWVTHEGTDLPTVHALAPPRPKQAVILKRRPDPSADLTSLARDGYGYGYSTTWAEYSGADDDGNPST